MREEILLIDGSSLLSTNYYATLDRRYHMAKTEKEKQVYIDKLLKTKDGRFINGVFGMTRSLENLLNKRKFKYIVIGWDKSRENTFRKELYPEYKSHRDKTPPSLKEQYQTALEFFNELGISQFRYDEYEADDIVGTLAKKFNDISTYIWSKDQDLLQLVDRTTRMWLMTSKSEEMMIENGIEKEMIEHFKMPDNVFEHTSDSIKHFYGLTPKQIIDKKAIEGDTSDNIPGISGVGKKTVTPLLQEFGSIEGIYDFLENTPLKEMKNVFRELGIRSPLNKMMVKVKPKDIIPEVVDILVDVTSKVEDEGLRLLNELTEKQLDKINKNEMIEFFETIDDKLLKKIYKKLGKISEFESVINKVGQYDKGEVYKDALLYKKLTTIKTDIPELEDVKLSDFCCQLGKRKEVYKKYQFKSLL